MPPPPPLPTASLAIMLRRAWPRLRLPSPATVTASRSIWSCSSARSDWGSTMTQAEQAVGSPTSFNNVRNMLGNEMTTIAHLARQLLGSNHPFLHAARGQVFGGKASRSRHVRGLVVLLMSKAVAAAGGSSSRGDGRRASASPASASEPALILPKQRALAEISELIYAGTSVHGTTVELDAATAELSGDGKQDMKFGNKMAVLGGDFLLASACTALAKLHNTEVVSLMSSTISDAAEAAFEHVALTQGPLPVDKWKRMAYLSTASLFAKSCQCAAMLGNRDVATQEAAYTFGEALGFVLKIESEMKEIHERRKTRGAALPLDSLPLSLALAASSLDNDALHTFRRLAAAACNSERTGAAPTEEEQQGHDQLRTWFASTSGSSDALELSTSFANTARTALQQLPSSDSRDILARLVDSSLSATRDTARALAEK
eukprot:m.138879 g.138879  ORF g.138879 m.138879 type:complete len:432 (+) comp16642_c0_seq4:104-1399(+)